MDKAIIFYDGNCGLCHALVKFVLKRDKKDIFNFSPRQGHALRNYLEEKVISMMPDSIIVIDTDAKVYVKAFAVNFILNKLGAFWSLLSGLSRLLPWKVQNNLYDLVAGNRFKLFSYKSEICPVLPPEFRSKFLA